ncbi:MAG: hypothetical protein MUO43_12400 [Desulfobacterales bacterium]|nr:hypothetical protein [Desulfobacterales bacterium]
MNKILWCFLLLIFSCGFLIGAAQFDDLPRVSYTIEPEFLDNSMILHVEMMFLGDSTGRTKLFLPDEWAGQLKLYESISNLDSLNPKVKIQETGKPQSRMIIHEPDQWIKINYSVKQQWEGPLEGQRFQKYWPVIGKEHFHIYGMVFFLYPERFRFGLTHFEISWKNFPKNWSIVNSFGCQERRQNFSAFLENVRRSVYVGGDYRIKKVLIQKNPVYITLRGGEWHFSDDEFYSFVENLITEERNF